MTNNITYASFWRRFFSLFIELSLYNLLSLLLLLSIKSFDSRSPESFFVSFIFVSVLVLLFMLHFSMVNHSATLGERILAIKVIDNSTNGKISKRQAFKRSILIYLLHLAPGTFIGLFFLSKNNIFNFLSCFVIVNLVNYLAFFINYKRQGIADIVSDTVVIKNPEGREIF